ncbi:MAG: YdeI family protein [Erysipelotrichaceae bacterium]
MANIELNPKVDGFISREKKWQAEYVKLRAIVLGFELSEELKWGVPCYTYQNSNVVLMHGFKDYCALLFIKGSLLHDTHNMLIQQTENVQAGRQIRFKNIDDIVNHEAFIKEYIHAAIEVEKSGLEVNFKKSTEYEIPEEFLTKLYANSALKTAFEALTPGRQRAYILYFSAAKQSKTREQRIEKYLEQILGGKGLDD